MATFIWDAAVQWPPPANILLNYDVVVDGEVIPALGSTGGVSKMAAVEVTISGVLYDKLSRTTRPCVLIGEASLTGLEIGGGPSPPGQGGGDPPHIWGPTDPRPTNPIAGIPGLPGYQPPGRPPGTPPGFWGGGPHPGGGPIYPEPPGMPTEPPPEGGDKPPPDSGGWGFVAEWSKWGYFPKEGEAQPK